VGQLQSEIHFEDRLHESPAAEATQALNEMEWGLRENRGQ
jgi:hypothetical protein